LPFYLVYDKLPVSIKLSKTALEEKIPSSSYHL